MMPKKQSTAAHKARQRQAVTGEKYTTALRAARCEAESELIHVGCCVAIEEVAALVRDRFAQGGVPALLTQLGELRESMWSRSPHYDVFSGHAVVLAVDEACAPWLYRVWQAGVVSEPVLLADDRQQVLQTIDGMRKVLSEMAAEELRD